MMQGDLHPIMFLLNPRAPTTSIAVPTFTSHYVPIKSKTKTEVKVDVKQFTSHYVPIKS